MKSKLNAFLKAMEGSWISQKTTYYLKTNQICCNQFKYKITRNEILNGNYDINKLSRPAYSLEYYNTNQKQKSHYDFSNNNQYNLGLVRKNNNKHLGSYKYSVYKHNCLKIEYKTTQIEYIEYIHAINQKFTTSVSLLKKLDRYIAISFSSNIKTTALDC